MVIFPYPETLTAPESRIITIDAGATPTNATFSVLDRAGTVLVASEAATIDGTEVRGAVEIDEEWRGWILVAFEYHLDSELVKTGVRIPIR